MTSGSYQPSGRHLLADLHGIAADKLNHPTEMELLLIASAKAAGATVLSSYFHHFGVSQGVTGVVLLAESHISIHTWPECGFAAVDIFMCGATQPERALEVIQHGLQAAQCSVQSLIRGSGGGQRCNGIAPESASNL